MWLVRLIDSVCATLSAGLNALHGRALVHECFADEQLFLAEGQTLLGCLLTSVSYCRSNDLVYRFRKLPGGRNFRIARASSACLPRIRLTTRRAFIGVTRTKRADALASIAYLSFVYCRKGNVSLSVWTD